MSTAQTEHIIDAEVVTVDTPEPSTELTLAPIPVEIVPFVTDRDKLETLERRFSAFASTAAVLTVITPETKKVAVDHIRRWKTDRKDAEAIFKPIKQSIDRVKSMALDWEKRIVGLVDGPITVITSRVSAYDTAVAREQEERRRALIAAEAERIRLELEAAAAAAQVDAALFAVFDDEFETATPLQAPLAMTEGEILEQAALDAPAPAEPEKVPGQYFVDAHYYELTSLDALIDAVIAGTVPRAALMANGKFLQQQADAMGEHLGYPGVRTWTVKQPRYRSAS